MLNFKKKAAFTLAETLITLAIIGIIAALTVPNLINRYQEQVTVNKVKKFHSTLTQALPQAIRDYGTVDTWGLISNDQNSAEKIYKQLIKPYFKVSKDCGFDNKGGCVADIYYKMLNGQNFTYKNSTSTSHYKFALSDGSISWVKAEINNKDDGTPYYIAISIDTNGTKSPNQFGKDLFTFIVDQDTIKVTGAPNSTCFFDLDMNNKKGGNSTSAWVVYMGNMDYLRCPEKLSWDGKHSCRE